jgi:hypothetical protein
VIGRGASKLRLFSSNSRWFRSREVHGLGLIGRSEWLDWEWLIEIEIGGGGRTPGTGP